MVCRVCLGTGGATSHLTPVLAPPAPGIVRRGTRTRRIVQPGSPRPVLFAARDDLPRLLRLLPSPTCLVALHPVLFAARDRVVIT